MIDNEEYATIKELMSEWKKLSCGFYGNSNLFVNKFNNTLKRTYFLSRKYLLNNFALPEIFTNIIEKMRDYINENAVEYRSNNCVKEYYIATKNITGEFVYFLCFGRNMREAADFCYYYVQLFLHYYDEYGKSVLAQTFPNLSFSNSEVSEVMGHLKLLKDKGIIFE